MCAWNDTSIACTTRTCCRLVVLVAVTSRVYYICCQIVTERRIPWIGVFFFWSIVLSVAASYYGLHSTAQERLENRSSITLSWKRCPGVSSCRHACSNVSLGSSSSSTSPLAPSSRSILTRHSLHLSSKLSPSIRMIRLCKMIQTRAHMMITM